MLKQQPKCLTAKNKYINLSSQYREAQCTRGNVLQEVEGSLVQGSTESSVMSLSKTCYPLLSTGSTQEDVKTPWHDCKLQYLDVF